MVVVSDGCGLCTLLLLATVIKNTDDLREIKLI